MTKRGHKLWLGKAHHIKKDKIIWLIHFLFVHLHVITIYIEKSYDITRSYQGTA